VIRKKGDAMERPGQVAGKVAMVTGSASGIGAETARWLAREGAQVMVADIHLDGARQVAEAIRAAGGKAAAVHMDLRDAGSIEAALAACIETFGGLDVLHNNAADTRLSSTHDGPLETLDVKVWDDLMAANLRGTMLATKGALPLMRRRGGGSIIMTSSGSAQAGMLTATAYGVGKAALDGLVRYVATQHGKQGIRCNAIAPGLIVTPSTEQTYAASDLGRVMLDHHLTPRLGKPEDIAAMVVFLASDASAFINGQVINVDGGLLAHQPFTADFSRVVPTN
jgi:NAD(P)-dependent dehydrogenase (short-subunit alcohol dehydrogenase family)